MTPDTIPHLRYFSGTGIINGTACAAITDVVYEPYTILAYCADHPCVPTTVVADAYATERSFDDPVAHDPARARGYLASISDEDYADAETYVDDNLLLDRDTTLDEHTCIVARVAVYLARYEEFVDAVDFLWAAIADGKLTETAPAT